MVFSPAMAPVHPRKRLRQTAGRCFADLPRTLLDCSRADTHAALWCLLRCWTIGLSRMGKNGAGVRSRLSVTARAFMEQAAVMGQNILISAISLGEIVYLVE